MKSHTTAKEAIVHKEESCCIGFLEWLKACLPWFCFCCQTATKTAAKGMADNVVVAAGTAAEVVLEDRFDDVIDELRADLNRAGTPSAHPEADRVEAQLETEAKHDVRAVRDAGIEVVTAALTHAGEAALVPVATDAIIGVASGAESATHAVIEAGEQVDITVDGAADGIQATVNKDEAQIANAAAVALNTVNGIADSLRGAPASPQTPIVHPVANATHSSPQHHSAEPVYTPPQNASHTPQPAAASPSRLTDALTEAVTYVGEIAGSISG